jgi:hypothetical protein
LFEWTINGRHSTGSCPLRPSSSPRAADPLLTPGSSRDRDFLYSATPLYRISLEARQSIGRHRRTCVAMGPETSPLLLPPQRILDSKRLAEAEPNSARLLRPAAADSPELTGCPCVLR